MARQNDDLTGREAAGLHLCATCDELVTDDHPDEWLLPDGTWTHDQTNPDIVR